MMPVQTPVPLHRTRRVRLVAAVVALGAVGLGACSSDSGDDADAADATTSTTNAVQAAAERLDGRYAHYDVVAYEGDGMKTLIVSYGFTDLEATDDELIATESFCFSEHRSDQPIKVEMPDAATQAIVPESIAVDLSVDNGKARFFRPETPTGIGVDLADPANDPLPTDPDDPRIADDDGDGKPGFTVRIEVSPELKGELYLARREIFAYDVTEQDDGSLTGTVTDGSEQLAIGASNPLFLTDAQWTQHPDPAKSPIILKPVSDDWDCDRLRAERPGLFPPTPKVDW